VLEIWREIVLLTLFAYNLLASGMMNIKAGKKKKTAYYRTGKEHILSRVSKILRTPLNDLEPILK